MNEHTTKHELSSDGRASIEAVDRYLERAIQDGRPLEALSATRWLGEIVDARAKEAAHVATEGSWSWSDVGRALGVTKQAAHEKLRARIQGRLDKERSKLEDVEQAGHAKIASHARRVREKLDELPQLSPKVEAARQRVADSERRRHEKLSKDVQKAREAFDRAEQKVQAKLNKKGSAG